MAAVQPRSTHRAGRTLLVGFITLAHVAVFLAASLSLPKEAPPHAEPTLHTFAAVLPPEPLLRLSTRAQPRTVREKREAKKKPASAGAPAEAPAPAPSSTLPAQGPAGELADPYAMRDALRGSVGCDTETLKLRPDEQARCADRTARWARRGRKIGPAEDDPKRAAELAAEEDFQRRMLDWRTTDCGIHNANDELDERGTLGQWMPPHRGKPKDGEDEARRNAC